MNSGTEQDVMTGPSPPGKSQPVGKAGIVVAEEMVDLVEIIGQYETRLLRYVAHMMGGQCDEAQDIVQDVFIRLHKEIEKNGGTRIKNVRCWLYRVAHNMAMDMGRRRARRKRLQERVMNDPVINPENQETGVAAPDGEAARHEARELAMGALQELPDEQRNVLLLKIIQGMTLREISAVTGLKMGTVNYRLTQGLGSLSKQLKAAGAI